MTIDKSPLMPLPPEELVGRVSGSKDVNSFSVTGGMTLSDWKRALSSINKTFDDFLTIVDFGCGCGRVLRHLRPILSINQELIGMDVDEEAVAWVKKNYPSVKTITLDLMPPSNLATASIDLIVNQSVFTHLPEDVQFAWLAELQRILKPGGIAILTFHGRKVWKDFCQDIITGGRATDAIIWSASYYNRGFFYLQGRSGLEQELPLYYGSAFHTINYIEESWGKYFSICSWLPVASLNHQDIVVLKRN